MPDVDQWPLASGPGARLARSSPHAAPEVVPGAVDVLAAGLLRAGGLPLLVDVGPEQVVVADERARLEHHELIRRFPVGEAGRPREWRRPWPGGAQSSSDGLMRGTMHFHPACSSWAGVTPSALAGSAVEPAAISPAIKAASAVARGHLVNLPFNASSDLGLTTSSLPDEPGTGLVMAFTPTAGGLPRWVRALACALGCKIVCCVGLPGPTTGGRADQFQLRLGIRFPSARRWPGCPFSRPRPRSPGRAVWCRPWCPR